MKKINILLVAIAFVFISPGIVSASGEYYDMGSGYSDYNFYADSGYSDYSYQDSGYSDYDFYGNSGYSDYNYYGDSGYSDYNFYGYPEFSYPQDTNTVYYPQTNQITYVQDIYPIYQDQPYYSDYGYAQDYYYAYQNQSYYSDYGYDQDYYSYNDYGYGGNYGGGCTSNCGGSYNPPTRYDDLDVVCSVSDRTIEEDDSVRFTADADGGRGPYTYRWSGDVSGTGRNITEYFNNSGTYYATVRVTDRDGRTATANCSSVRVERDGNRGILSSNTFDYPNYPTGNLASVGSVYLNQIPYTGPEDTAKGIAFVVGILAWSIAGALIIQDKMNKKAVTNRIEAFKNANRTIA